MSEEIKVVSEDAAEAVIETVDEMIPDTDELKKLGLVLVGTFVVGGVTYYLCRKIKLGTKIKNGLKKINPFGKKQKEAPEAEATDETEE